MSGRLTNGQRLEFPGSLGDLKNLLSIMKLSWFSLGLNMLMNSDYANQITLVNPLKCRDLMPLHMPSYAFRALQH